MGRKCDSIEALENQSRTVATGRRNALCAAGLKALQAPLKSRYREEPAAALIRLSAEGGVGPSGMTCGIETGKALNFTIGNDADAFEAHQTLLRDPADAAPGSRRAGPDRPGLSVLAPGAAGD